MCNSVLYFNQITNQSLLAWRCSEWLSHSVMGSPDSHPHKQAGLSASTCSLRDTCVSLGVESIHKDTSPEATSSPALKRAFRCAKPAGHPLHTSEPRVSGSRATAMGGRPADVIARPLSARASVPAPPPFPAFAAAQAPRPLILLLPSRWRTQ